jgi:glycosyltransferase involved in cell wall biosynthesis
MKKIAIHLNNKDISTINFKNIGHGNPGVGYSDYFPVALTYYLQHFYSAAFDFILFADEVDNMPSEIRVEKVADITDAAIKAKKLKCDVFIFRARMNEEKFILRLIDKLKLKSIGVAQLTPTPEHVRKLANCNQLKALVCVGREQYDFLIDTKLHKKLVVINNAVDIEAYSSKNILKKDFNLVTYLGALIPQKGFHVLARAWPIILKKCPEAKLSVIGSTKIYGDERSVGRFGVANPEYEEKCIAKYLTDRNGNLLPSVKLHGQMGEQKNKILAKSLIGVANPTGETETCCVSALEFSASATVVVSGAYYALLNSVKNNITGLLGKTHKDLAKNIIFLLENPNQAIKMGHAGKQYVKDNFSFKVVLPQWIELINFVIYDKKMRSPIGPTRNIFKHRKFFRMINHYIQKLVGKYLNWPSIQEVEHKLHFVIKDLKFFKKNKF